MRKRVLLTGGNGFVGREVLRQLSAEHDVTVVDNLRSGPKRLRPDELSQCRFLHADITDASAMSKVMTEFQPDTIIHLAAIHYIPECEDNPALAVRTNIDGTLNLLTTAPSGAQFVFASSGAVYKPDDKPHNERSSELGPSDVYGYTKLHGEHYVRYFAQQRGLSAIVVRLFNVVGPGETNPHLLPEIVAQLKAGHKVLRLGNLWPKRDYIHVRDAARGFVSVALQQGLEAGQALTVNLGTSQTYSVAEIVDKLKRVSTVDFCLEQEASRQRKVDRPHLAADIHEIHVRFGWQPQQTIEDALADLWREPDMTPALAGKYRL